MTAYDDLASPAQMREDCRAAGRHLRLERAAEKVSRPAPSILFEDYPQDVKKPEIAVTEAAARLGAAVHLHLD